MNYSFEYTLMKTSIKSMVGESAADISIMGKGNVSKMFIM